MYTIRNEICNLYITNNLVYDEQKALVYNRKEELIRPQYKLSQQKYQLAMASLVNKILNGTISITDYAMLNIDIKYTKIFEFLNAVILIETLDVTEKKDGLLSMENYIKKIKAQEFTNNMAISLGELVTEILIEKKLFVKELNNMKVPYLTLTDEPLYLDVIASSVFTKPLVTNDPIRTKAEHKIFEHFSITLKTKSNLLNNEANVKLYPKEPLINLLKQNTAYKIASSNYDDFVKYIEEVLQLPFDRNNPTIQSFLWVYAVDFNKVLMHTKHPALGERLMRFGLKLDILIDKDLLKACDTTSPCCLRIYNMIISYKYYLKGLLNDVAIYKKFNYFY